MNSAGIKAEIDRLRLKIAELMARKPEKAAIILTEWIGQGSSKDVKKAGHLIKMDKKAG